MDNCIEKEKFDEFEHKDISYNILNLIKNDKYPVPYNIALIGKWGLGKSSILKLLEDSLKKDDKCYKVITINAWKYEGEILKKVFLKEIYENVSGCKVNYVQQLVEHLKEDNTEEKKEKKNIKSVIWSLIVSFLPYLLISLVLSLVWQIARYVSYGYNLRDLLSYNLGSLLCKYLNFYFDKFLITFGLPALAKSITELAGKKTNVFPLTIDDPNDYEMLLKKLVKKKTKIDKFIIIIDDLDRLSTQKMVEALNTLKTLMEIDKCVFIVPFDDSILKDALNTRIVSEFDNEQQTIESEFILDKLFQFRFYIPPLINSDMKDYTLNIIKSESTDLANMFDDEELEEIVKRVFMYGGLKTPRQIKKIINTFSNNMLLFSERISEGKVDSKLLDKNGKLMIAKISVLQSDFNDFYDELFIEPDICEKMLKANKNKYKSLPKIIQKYFISKDGEIIIKEQYNKLINFLSRTSYIKSSDMIIYLYCNQDEMSLLHGSKFNQDLLDSMQSMNFTSMNNIIRDNKPDNIKKLFLYYLEKDTAYNLPMLIISIMNVENFKFNDDEFNRKYINFISNVYDSGEKFDLRYVNIEKLLQLNKKYDAKSISKLLNDWFELLNDSVKKDTFNHDKIFRIAIENLDALKNVDDKLLKSYLLSLCKKDFLFLDILNSISVDGELLKRYFGMELYKFIVIKLNEDDDSSRSDVYSELLKKLYNCLKNDLNVIDINSGVIGLLNNEANISVCEEIITNNVGLFTDNEKIAILNKIAVMSDDELELQYFIVNSLGINVMVASEDMEDKIISFANNNYDIENILNNVDDYSNINNVVINLNSEIYGNSKLDSIYRKNIGKFTDEQLDDLVGTLASKININTYKEGRLTSIVNIIGSYVRIDAFVNTFDDDDLIKNENSANEIIGIIKSDEEIDNGIIDYYVKRVIELLPTNIKNLGLLMQLVKYVSLENLNFLVTTVDKKVVDSLEKDDLQLLFKIYKSININEDTSENLTTAFNSLIDTKISNQVISYMIINNIKVRDSVGFVFENISNFNELKKLNGLNSILTIDDKFIEVLIERLNDKEYTLEQLKYLNSLSENVSGAIINDSLIFSNNNKVMLCNVQKLINAIYDENRLATFQTNVLNSNDIELIIDMLKEFFPIKKSENRKLIRMALKDLINADSTDELLIEKLTKFAKDNSYKGLKKKN